MKDVEYFTKLLAKAQAELAEIEASSHPFRDEFVIAWRKRIENVKLAIAYQKQRQEQRKWLR